MTTEANLIGVPIQWQTAALHVTTRGRVKQIVTGIPGDALWHHWKKNGVELRATMQGHGITLARIAKGQWEVRLWVNARNLATALNLAELGGFSLPEVPKDVNPF